MTEADGHGAQRKNRDPSALMAGEHDDGKERQTGVAAAGGVGNRGQGRLPAPARRKRSFRKRPRSSQSHSEPSLAKEDTLNVIPFKDEAMACLSFDLAAFGGRAQTFLYL
jgi:hypothetical protein